MREYAAADLSLRCPERAGRVYASMRWPWYAPLNEHPEWAAWGIVLELALRRASAVWAGTPHAWDVGTTIEPASDDRAAVLVPPRRAPRSVVAPRRSLSIEVGALGATSSRLNSRTTAHEPLRPVIWELRPHTVPWWVHSDPHRPATTPDPHLIWGLALGHARALESPALSLFLEGHVDDHTDLAV